MRWPWSRRSDAHTFAATSARRDDLFNERAVGLFTERLFGIADPDVVLRKLGKRRRDLVALEYDDEIEDEDDLSYSITPTPHCLASQSSVPCQSRCFHVICPPDSSLSHVETLKPILPGSLTGEGPRRASSGIRAVMT